MNNKKKNRRFLGMTIRPQRLDLHFIYVFVIFTLFTAFLVSDRWTDKSDFTTYLTNVATFVSVVLGLVAIFYSFISNSSLSASLGNISKVSDEVVQTKTQIESFLRHANDLEKIGADNTSSLKEISISVEKHVASLREALGCITETTESLHKSVSGGFDKVETLLTASSGVADKASKEEPNPHAIEISDERAEDFLVYTSLIGLSVLFGCVLAKKTGKKFSIDETANIFSFDVSYMHGYFIASCAAGFISDEEVEGDGRTFKIIGAHKIIENKIKSTFVERLESMYKKDNPEALNKYQKDITTIENFYES